MRFYSLLGFEPIPAPSGVEGRAVWLARPGDRDGAQIHLLTNDDARPQQGHIAFVVPAYEATVARLREAGFEVQPRREHWGSPRAYVRDPASNLVELMAEAPREPRQ